MQNFIALFILAGCALTTAQQSPYAQCGGINWTGGTTCTPGWTCVYSNPYYSQCLQSSSTSSTSSATSSTSPSTSTASPYAQCGGINWTGSTTCTSGWTCVYSNPYYSQCLQASSSSSISPATSTVSSSTSAATPYGQCGGINWTGSTTCTSGWTCVYSNPYYSQCLQVSSSSSSTSTSLSTSTSSSTISTTSSTSKTTSTATSTTTKSSVAATTKATTSTSSAVTSSSTNSSISSSPSSSTSTATQAAQTPYAQCGGIGWTGGTTCTSGWTCVYSNPYYSQCLQVTSISSSTSPTTSSSKSTTTSIVSISTSSIPTTTPSQSTSTSTSSTSTSTSSPSPSTSTSSASFTHYGAGDTFGSPNCNTDTAACGFYTYPGYSAAVSQNLYGAGPGAGAGPACGTCWRLTGETDSSGNALSNAGTTIVVMVNNLCPAEGNPLCAQDGLGGTNQYGANVNFDLCSDSGAQAAFFGNDGEGLAVGTATQVSCSEWSGTVVH